jgi:uncharacterized protein YegL
MGWASYQEDIESRFFGARRDKTATCRAWAQEAATPVGLSAQQGKNREGKQAHMSKLKEFTISEARPLPVILLADVSGSMAAEGKIDALNGAVAEMVAAFAEEDAALAEIRLAVVTFGAEARLHRPLTAARQVSWEPMRATGRTPMGAAFDLATDLIEDRERVPSRAYRPTLVLVSDGVPTDDWRTPLARLLGSERAGKAQRFALAIGADADRDMLAAFLADPESRVFEAHESRQIKRFFRRVTMSVGLRSRSATPDRSVVVSPEELDDFDDY